jgi:hypothetical protein
LAREPDVPAALRFGATVRALPVDLALAVAFFDFALAGLRAIALSCNSRSIVLT